MKKFCIFALSILILLSFTACGKRNNKDTEMTLLPTMDPTIGTNIPDPDVDTKMPMYTDGTDATDGTMPFGGTDTTDPMARRGY